LFIWFWAISAGELLVCADIKPQAVCEDRGEFVLYDVRDEAGESLSDIVEEKMLDAAGERFVHAAVLLLGVEGPGNCCENAAISVEEISFNRY
jgi:hypothetical protein